MYLTLHVIFQDPKVQKKTDDDNDEYIDKVLDYLKQDKQGGRFDGLLLQIKTMMAFVPENKQVSVGIDIVQFLKQKLEKFGIEV